MCFSVRRALAARFDGRRAELKVQGAMVGATLHKEAHLGLAPMMLILHDDVSLSPLFYLWAKAAKESPG